MKKLLIFALAVGAVALLSCIFDPGNKREKVSRPAIPSGPGALDIDGTGTYRSGGATSTRGHEVEYRFDLDAGGLHRYTSWSGADSADVSWPDSGLYVVKAQARCALHKHVVSPWSGEKRVAVATALDPPWIRFATNTGVGWQPYDAAAPLDTVGMFRPFEIGYHGISPNGAIDAYKFFSLSAGVILPGGNVWTTDLSDTLRSFPNTGADALPSGVFRLAAQCRDELDAESIVDVGSFDEGVVQVVVNYDPDTRITGVRSSYTVDDVVYLEDVNFKDAIPDTVPMDSWVRIDYRGSDDPRDGSTCPQIDADLCIGFQVAYESESARIPGAGEFSTWQPRSGLHDTDPFSAVDSNSFSIGSLEYGLYARAVDEFGRPDGTPPHVGVIGNHDPVLDEVVVEDHLGNRIDLSIVDTITWNFWKGEGWPYQCECDTLDKPEIFCGAVPNDPPSCGSESFPENGGTFDFYKKFSFSIKATGHDHPKDPTGSGIKSWKYLVMNSSGQFINFGKSLAGWFESGEIDVLDDVIRWKVYYPGPFTANPDPFGDTVIANLPSWMDDDLTFYLMGRDTAKFEGEFEQYIFINGEKRLFNAFSSASLGRWTEEKVFAFRITVVRP